ncbi:hypothetical protein HAX54_044052 [Datura stramonium]|uniref:Uncharacterized protein n=1 Tax=Datura stramonium TaxID=4076 RepID=A0ABS8W5L8_DATST|nr:hypothetical protein [Datura stramonium]
MQAMLFPHAYSFIFKAPSSSRQSFSSLGKTNASLGSTDPSKTYFAAHEIAVLMPPTSIGAEKIQKAIRPIRLKGSEPPHLMAKNIYVDGIGFIVPVRDGMLAISALDVLVVQYQSSLEVQCAFVPVIHPVSCKCYQILCE